jgi:hypothetical protein
VISLLTKPSQAAVDTGICGVLNSKSVPFWGLLGRRKHDVEEAFQSAGKTVRRPGRTGFRV